MRIPKLAVSALVLAVVFSGCGDQPKTRFKKGKDRSEFYRDNNLCGLKVSFCAYNTDSDIGRIETAVKPTPSNESETDANAENDSESGDTDSQAAEVAAVKAIENTLDDENVTYEETAETRTLDQQAALDALKGPAYGPVYKTYTRDRLKPIRGNEYELAIRIEVPNAGKKADDVQAERKAIAAFIEKTCVPRIESMLESSEPKINLKMGFVELEGNEFAMGEKESNLKLFVHPPRVKNATDAKTKRLVMSRWPFHSDLFPFEIEKNDEESRMEKSEPFCQTLAKLTVHLLGVSDPVAIAGECGKVQKPETSLAKTGAAVIGYKAGKADFWETAVLKAERDKKQIFRPLCKDERISSKTKSKKAKKDKKKSTR